MIDWAIQRAVEATKRLHVFLNVAKPTAFPMILQEKLFSTLEVSLRTHLWLLNCRQTCLQLASETRSLLMAEGSFCCTRCGYFSIIDLFHPSGWL